MEGALGVADIAGAARLLKAIHDNDLVTVVQVVMGTSALQPLLVGVTGLAVALGEKAAGDDSAVFRVVLDRLARALDPAGVADAEQGVAS